MFFYNLFILILYLINIINFYKTNLNIYIAKKNIIISFTNIYKFQNN